MKRQAMIFIINPNTPLPCDLPRNLVVQGDNQDQIKSGLAQALKINQEQDYLSILHIDPLDMGQRSFDTQITVGGFTYEANTFWTEIF